MKLRTKWNNIISTEKTVKNAIISYTNIFKTDIPLNIPPKLLDKIEVIQVSNILFLNIARVVEEALIAQGKFPSVLIIYFNNVPYFDNDAFDLLRELAKIAKSKKATVMISGTNGMLLDILRQKASTEKYNDAFGYIVPDFKTAIQQTVVRLSKTKSSNFAN